MNILLFAGGSAVLNSDVSVRVTGESVNNAIKWLEGNMQASGSTQLLPALTRAFDLKRLDPGAARTIVVMTDGYVTVEAACFDLIRTRMGDGNVFSFGIGSRVNRYLIEGMARIGQGEAFIVRSKQEGEDVVAKLQRYIDTPVLTRIRLSWEGSFSPRDSEPPVLPDLFASRPLQIAGKWSGELSGTMRLTGTLANGTTWEYGAELATLPITRLAAVPLLWARSRIAVLSDYAGRGKDNKNAIVSLGLAFSLMTQHTSFVAIDSLPAVPDFCASERSSNTPNSSVHEHAAPAPIASPFAASDASAGARTASTSTSSFGYWVRASALLIAVFSAMQA